MADDTSSYFVRTGEGRFHPTAHTAGAWSTAEQHISPLNGLVVHELERFVAARAASRADDARDGLVIARIGFDIFGVIPIDEFDVTVEVLRPGRTIELLEAVVTQYGRTVCRARAWRLAPHDTAAVAGGQPDPLPRPDSLEPWPLTDVWPGGYIDSVEMRPVGSPRPGRATTWLSTTVPLLPDEPVSDLARLVGLVDTANGVAVREDPAEWMFPNVDLTIHLYRQPAGTWLGLDTTVVFGASGQGLTSSVLHDADGPVGRAEQVLAVRRLR